MTNVERVKQILIDQGIEDDYNEYQMEYISRGYTSSVFRDSGFDEATYFQWLAETDKVSFSDKYEFVARAMIDDRFAELAKAIGWALAYVGSGDKDPAFVYTKELDKITGFELISVNIPDPSTAEKLMNTVCAQLRDGSIQPNEVFTLTDFNIGGQDARLKIIDPIEDSVRTAVIGEATTVVKQLWLADANNLLPDETGYDTTFVQTLSEE